jgi:hypothetical protein
LPVIGRVLGRHGVVNIERCTGACLVGGAFSGDGDSVVVELLDVETLSVVVELLDVDVEFPPSGTPTTEPAATMRSHPAPSHSTDDPSL